MHGVGNDPADRLAGKDPGAREIQIEYQRNLPLEGRAPERLTSSFGRELSIVSLSSFTLRMVAFAALSLAACARDAPVPEANHHQPPPEQALKTVGVTGEELEGDVSYFKLLSIKLQVTRLQPKETAKGFVLFDLPAWRPGSNLDELDLMYHPARFGGSTQLFVKLADG